LGEEKEDKPLTPSSSLYGTGLTGMFSDSLTNRYLSYFAVSVGVTLSQMGLLRAAQSISGNLLQVFWGQLVDKKGKKPFILVGRILKGLFLGLIIFSKSSSIVIMLVIGVSICISILSPAWSSLVGDYTSQSTRGATIGKIIAVSQLGGLLAMVLAFGISLSQKGDTTPASYFPLLAISGVTSIFSGFLSLLNEEKPPKSETSRLNFSFVLKDSRFKRYLFLNMFFGISLAFAWPLFPFIIVNKLGMKIWQISIFAISSSITSILSQRYLGKLMDNIGRRPVIVFSRLSLFIFPLVYVFSTSWIHIVLAEAFLGIGRGAWMSSESTYLIDLAPEGKRATYLATNTAIFGISMFVGNISGGYLTENYLQSSGAFQGIHLGLVISAIFRLLTGLLYVKIYETYSKTDN
jgi:MFS family permease